MDVPVSCYMSKQTNLVTEFLPTQHVQTQLDIVARGPGIGGGGGPPACRRPHPLAKGYLRMEFGGNQLVSKNFRVRGIEKHR
jgi:hypothetical protein